jgi:hypothetical protein
MGRSTLRALSAAVVVAAAGTTACGGMDTQRLEAGPDRSAEWSDALAFRDFVESDTARQSLWRTNARVGAPADLVARARALDGPWKLLVLAENGCPDAAYSVPFLAALADSVPGIDLRVLRIDGYDHLFAGYEKDGRAAHPLVLVLDDSGRERGGWVERPAELAAWIDARRGVLPDEELRLYRNGWYEGNLGRGALGEVLALVDDIRVGRAPATPRTSVASDVPVTPCPAPGE